MTIARIISPTLALLLIAASRSVYIRRLLDMTGDEVWSVWQTLGTPQQIIHWTPFDWPPGYYLILGGWWRLTGLHSIPLRYLMLLVFMIGCAAVFRVAVRLFGVRAGLPALLMFGAFGWSVFGSLHLRGHSFTLSLSPGVLWLALRYFDRPRIWRGVPLGVLMAFMVYIHSTAVVYFAVLGLFTLIVYGGPRVLRWWLPGVVMLVLTLPEIVNKLGLVGQSRLSGFTYERPGFYHGMERFYDAIWGRSAEVWLPVVIGGAVLAVWAARGRWRLLAGLLTWCAMPLLLWLTHEQLALFFIRYVLWYLTGLALLAAWGLTVLPRWARAAVTVALVVVLFTPMDIKNYDDFGENVGSTLSWLSRNMQPGDALVVDPEVIASTPLHEEWDLFAQMFFPQGLPLTTTPQPHQRVWYTRTATIDEATQEMVSAGRMPGQFFGEITLFTQVFEAPPDPDGVLFENGMRFHGAQLLHRGQVLHRTVPAFHEEEPVTLRLWWSADARIDLDYSVGIFVRDNGSTRFSSDSAPQLISLLPGSEPPPGATSQWQPGVLYLEERQITIPQSTDDMVLTVYQWWDGVRIPAAGTDDDDFLLLTPLHVRAW
ncbi:MAG: glycosyltransferase family 39 protein [Chloroflexota bacterium]